MYLNLRKMRKLLPGRNCIHVDILDEGFPESKMHRKGTMEDKSLKVSTKKIIRQVEKWLIL